MEMVSYFIIIRHYHCSTLSVNGNNNSNKGPARIQPNENNIHSKFRCFYFITVLSFWFFFDSGNIIMFISFNCCTQGNTQMRILRTHRLEIREREHGNRRERCNNKKTTWNDDIDDNNNNDNYNNSSSSSNNNTHTSHMLGLGVGKNVRTTSDKDRKRKKMKRR